MLENMLMLNSWFATGILIIEIVLVIKLLFYIFGDKETLSKAAHWSLGSVGNFLGAKNYLDRYIVIVIFLFSLFSSIMTLVYSEYFGLIPCALCWFERIFMYGIVLMSGIALWAKDEEVIQKYVLNFSILGALTALYHHVLQMSATATSHLPCPASGGDCAKRTIFEYDHITFPWMAFVVFVMFIMVLLVRKKIK